MENGWTELVKQRDELLEALEGLVGLAKYRDGHLDEYKAAIKSAENLIAKHKEAKQPIKEPA